MKTATVISEITLLEANVTCQPVKEGKHIVLCAKCEESDYVASTQSMPPVYKTRGPKGPEPLT